MSSTPYLFPCTLVTRVVPQARTLSGEPVVRDIQEVRSSTGLFIEAGSLSVDDCLSKAAYKRIQHSV